MSDLQSILLFLTIIFVLLMAYPKRGTVASRNFKNILGVLPLSKMFDSLKEYYNKRR